MSIFAIALIILFCRHSAEILSNIMGVNIQFSQSYYWLNSWVLANIIQLATQDFCEHFVDYRMDPGRRLYDQMTMAARCGVANIAEGSARHSTSVETEMRLRSVRLRPFPPALRSAPNVASRCFDVCRGKGRCKAVNSGDAAIIPNAMACCK